MPGPPAPGFCLCHLLSSADFPPVSHAASRSGCPDIGVACHPVHRDSHLDPGAKKAGCTQSRLPEEKDKRKSGCAGQISPGEFFASALRTFGWLVASAHRPQAPAKRLKTAG